MGYVYFSLGFVKILIQENGIWNYIYTYIHILSSTIFFKYTDLCTTLKVEG